MRSDSQAQKLLIIACSWAQHQYGWHKSILDNVGSRLPHFEARWLKALQRYLHRSNSQLELEKNYVYPLQRINDKYIMPRVVESGKFKDKDIQRINYCRIYLNVTTIVDVTLACGKKLDPHMYKGDRSLLSSAATHMRIHQQKSGLASWGVWRKAMALWAIECDLRVPLKRMVLPSLSVI